MADQLRANVDLLYNRLKNKDGIPVGQQMDAMRNWLSVWEGLRHQVEQAGLSEELKEKISYIEGELGCVRTFTDM